MSFVLDNGILQTKLDNECFLRNMLKGFESNNACLKRGHSKMPLHVKLSLQRYKQSTRYKTTRRVNDC